MGKRLLNFKISIAGADRFCLGWLLRFLRQPRIFGPRYLNALKLRFLLFRYRENLPLLRDE